jgi:thiamine-phosphate pyrophosphorylase
MARCYSAVMAKRYPTLPCVWLISDARNDAGLESALKRLPRGSGFIFRHYHMPPAARRARFDRLARIARGREHLVVLAGGAKEARAWGADGAYGPPHPLARGPRTIRLVTAHSMGEVAKTRRADAALLSPVFPTSSHPGGAVIGAVRFLLLARHSRCPVIALGGMSPARARQLGAPRWAAIDGLIPKDS